MNDRELNELLRSAPVPERPADYWEDFPRQVRAGIRTAPSTPRRSRPVPWGWIWASAAACVCLMVGFVLGHGQGAAGNLANDRALQSETLVREVLGLFPNRVRAIVQDEKGVQLVLSEQADVPESTPLWLQIGDGRDRRVLVTFSGQDLQIAGEKVEVLVDAQGQVMLVGDRLFWSSADPDRTVAHLCIQARPLGWAF